MKQEQHSDSVTSFSLKALGIVDAPPEKSFDELTKLAQSVFAVPVSLVSIVEFENDRQYFKSQRGLPEPWAGQRQTPLTHSFCQHVVNRNRPFRVDNALSHELVCDNLAIRDLNVVAYLGVPIYDTDQNPIGALCVIDTEPREWSESQVDTLQQLGNCVSNAIHLKAALKTSERLRAEQQKLLSNLERANEELERFSYIAAHDLQEPLRKIVSFSQLLQTECADQLHGDGPNYLNALVSGASRMQNLVQDLLEFSQLQSDSAQLTEVSTAAALDHALLNLAGSIDATEAVVTADRLPNAVAQEQQLVQLLQNLIGNGIKYCERKPEIHIGAFEDKDHYVISVKDNGIGIAPEYHDQIFGIFKRLHGRGKYSGTGIGLAICQRIVEQWQQDIWVESSDGIGSTFSFTLAKSPEKCGTTRQLAEATSH